MLRKALRILVWTALVCAVLVGLGYLMLEPWTVPSDDPQLAVSIEPSLSAGDVVLVARTKGASDSALVRCADPDAPGRFVVGRVVAHAGEHVEVTGGVLTVDGKGFSASIACDPPTVHLRNPTTQEDEELNCSEEELGGYHPILRRASGTPEKEKDARAEVEVGKAYLLSDNRVMHLDSRELGSVQTSSCQRVVLRLWGAGGWLDAKKRLTVLW